MSRILTRNDDFYPRVFHELADAPSRIFITGNHSLLKKKPALAVIGSRSMSPYGRTAIEMLIPPLVRSGVIIVSGLAIGCDGYAHEVALAEGGECIAVLPASLDRIYPRRHTPLSDALLKTNGLLLSEYPDGTPGPYAPHFLARNRLIAALADVVLIVEAAARSGTLSTARHALDLGRDVAALPGSITSALSAGTNQLLKHGAYVITAPEDLAVLLNISLTEAPKKLPRGETREEQTVLESLAHEPRSVDQLVAMSTMDTSVLLATLSKLEMRGTVARGENGQFTLSSS